MNILPADIDAGQFLTFASTMPVIDVRSPGEWEQGHIPGSVNVPLFDNEERAKVGTAYVKKGKDIAIELGHTIASRKTEYYLEGIRKLDANRGLLLHCWRGGLRSEKTAAFYASHGYKMFVLKGGYKAYRKYIRQQFALPRPILVLGGYTGTGKTQILNELKKVGQQVIDLESLANHRGSLFGHLGNQSQPTTEQFENNLYDCWQALDPEKVIWIEHESLTIGEVYLPDSFYNTMQHSNLFFLELEKQLRIQRLVDEYGNYDKNSLLNSIRKLSPFIGKAESKYTIKSLKNNELHDVASHLLDHYDKTYSNSLKRRPIDGLHRVALTGSDPTENAKIILQKAVSLGITAK